MSRKTDESLLNPDTMDSSLPSAMENGEDQSINSPGPGPTNNLNINPAGTDSVEDIYIDRMSWANAMLFRSFHQRANISYAK